MKNNYGNDILRFILLVAIQVLVLNQIDFGGYIDPALYLLFILLLPFEVPGWLLLISSFFLGFSVDIFSHSTGLHTAASVFAAFVRPGVINMVGKPAEYEASLKPGIADMGFRWFFIYALLIVLAHHFVLFSLEAFRFEEFLYVLLRILASTAFTLVFIITTEYIFMRKRH
ncbi:MAG: rod shape-determining protein MreD [Lentimicrobium sp.]|jgi:rod shape-determining protein MreD|nr:rod shape-determining protein MreD [Lentimicrobium sp.]MDD2528284.1 rod shape-determining protein MreD [Lentimicrobiaceae bacterium]MDD4598012.1 rod shape-determining protein MreD [Lentimicrobiaceae bacterium]MDY0025181.1 rod shape-determining protein MreD [Lentimicrobium sp.]HAH57446.1 rod shape-determining protein MreD [Bacteroidales bacterium]